MRKTNTYELRGVFEVPESYHIPFSMKPKTNRVPLSYREERKCPRYVIEEMTSHSTY